MSLHCEIEEIGFENQKGRPWIALTVATRMGFPSRGYKGKKRRRAPLFDSFAGTPISFHLRKPIVPRFIRGVSLAVYSEGSRAVGLRPGVLALPALPALPTGLMNGDFGGGRHRRIPGPPRPGALPGALPGASVILKEMNGPESAVRGAAAPQPSSIHGGGIARRAPLHYHAIVSRPSALRLRQAPRAPPRQRNPVKARFRCRARPRGSGQASPHGTPCAETTISPTPRGRACSSVFERRDSGRDPRLGPNIIQPLRATKSNVSTNPRNSWPHSLKLL